MKFNKNYKFCIYLTNEQKVLLEKSFGTWRGLSIIIIQIKIKICGYEEIINIAISKETNEYYVSV